MFQDIVFPNNNEKEFVDMALKLGTKSLIFVYKFKDKKTFEAQKKEIGKLKNIKADVGLIVDDKNTSKIPEDVEYLVSKAPSRGLIENRKSHILYDFEGSSRADFYHHRNSGLNQVFCNIIKDKKKVFGVAFSALLTSKKPGVLLGRMQQNARFARKYKLKTVIASFANTPNELRAEHEIKSFQKILGL